MFFNSIYFYIALILLWIVFRIFPKNARMSYLLFISYTLYAIWDYRFLSLLIISTLTDYFCAKKIYEQKSSKKRYLYLSIGINLLMLCLFKYFNFFLESLNNLLYFIGAESSFELFAIVFPLGISFYTFQTMSYTIDVYRGTLTPSKKFIPYALYVSYFPQLVAGPIERAGNLLPQINKLNEPRPINVTYAFNLILWGLVKKIVIADNLAPIVDYVFNDLKSFDVITIVFATFIFSIQLYCDFSAYSHIARGVSELFGIRLSVNFNFPLFSKNANEFWSRWHITLIKWIRDYLYKYFENIGLKKRSRTLTYLLVFSIIGLWHGASWSFVWFGLYSGIIFSIYRYYEFKTKNDYIDKISISLLTYFLHLISLLGCFFLFRATSLDAIIYLFSSPLLIIDNLNFLSGSFFYALIFIFPFLIIETKAFLQKDLSYLSVKNDLLRIILYFVLIAYIVLLGVWSKNQFVYFRF